MTTIENDTTKIKLQKKLGADACGEMEQKSPDDLRAYLASLGMHEQEIKAAREADAALLGAKEEVATLNGPYVDALRGNAQRRAYASILLSESGAVSTIDDAVDAGGAA